MNERDSISRRELFSKLIPPNSGEGGPRGTVLIREEKTPNPPSVSELTKQLGLHKLSRRELFNTFKQTGWTIIGLGFLQMVGASKIEFLNKGPRDTVYLMPQKDVPRENLRTSLLSPALEEMIFRLIPSLIFARNTDGYQWKVGVPTSIFFAILHTDHLRFPLHEFLFGLFSWHLMRKKGFVHAYFAHALNNTSAVLRNIITKPF